jgi:transglutaminase-like putative cysteine protease
MTVKIENVRISRWWDGWIAVAAIALTSMVAGRLWATDWTSDLYILVYVMFFAGLTGLALGYSHFSPYLAMLFSTVYGVFIIGWLFGTTVEMEMTWRDRILNYLGWRLRIAIGQFSAGETVYDPLLFLMIMALLLWVLGSAAAFILIRKGSVWPAVLPLGLTLLIIGHYDQDMILNSRFLLSFLFFTLLIIGRMTFLRYRKKWHQEGINTTAETQADLTKTLLILCAALVIFAWLLPVTPQQITRYSALWERLTAPLDNLGDQISDIFVPDPDQTSTRTTVFGETLGLGSGTPISEEIVFTVNVTVEPPAGYRNYWRARSYDIYSDGDWSTSPGLSERLLFPDEFDLQYPEWEGGEIAAYNITNNVNRMVNLYATGLPIGVSRPVQAVTQPIAESQEDLIALIADPVLSAGEMVEVETLVRLPSISELRSASTDYPDWLERYVQLPDDFSGQIADLAVEITDGLDNPYDQAYAITRYLRINIEYSRTLPPIPPGADPLEWFLFEGQQGFCNYYASAQVLMLRSLGIPARMSVGYAQGEFDDEMDSFIVRKRNSHAWPEVYFVDYGWVIFEPTVSEPAFILPAGSPGSDEDLGTFPPPDLPQMDLPPEDMSATELPPMEADGLEETSQRRFFGVEGIRIMWVMLILFVVGLLVTLIILNRPSAFKIDIDPLPALLEAQLIKWGKPVPDWLRNWRYRALMSVPESAYRQLSRAITWLGHPLNLAETPAERAQTLAKLLPEAEQPAQDIVNEYYLDKFSDHIINEERAKNAARLIFKLTLQHRLWQITHFSKRQQPESLQ